MKRFLTLIYICCITVCFSGCVVVFLNFFEFNLLTGQGEIRSYPIRVNEFSKIYIEGNINIDYSAGFSDSVILDIQPNLRNNINIYVLNDELRILIPKPFSSGTKTPVLTVSSYLLEQLTINGIVGFTSNNPMPVGSFKIIQNGSSKGTVELDVRSLYIDISGTGSLALFGQSDFLDVVMSGKTSLYASHLDSYEAVLELSENSYAEVNVWNFLEVTASDSAQVVYSQSPAIEQNLSGRATVIADN